MVAMSTLAAGSLPGTVVPNGLLTRRFQGSQFQTTQVNRISFEREVSTKATLRECKMQCSNPKCSAQIFNRDCQTI
uniref:Uncharacterized protein n=1 Tax=Aegilops tauschii subsp. strangulata TaxID=200361 RepID=A0A453JHT5_AEGTS